VIGKINIHVVARLLTMHKYITVINNGIHDSVDAETNTYVLYCMYSFRHLCYWYSSHFQQPLVFLVYNLSFR